MKKTFQGLSMVVMLAVLFAIAGCGSGGGSASTGAAGQNSVVVGQSAATLAECANGGIKVEAGIDVNSNGILDAAEVTSTQFVCDGADGADGTNGTNGTNGTSGTNGSDGAGGASVTLTPLPVGDAHCANGGTKVSVAGGTPPDAYVCNGADMNAAAKTETCTLCHKSSGVADVVEVHKSAEGTVYTATITAVSTPTTTVPGTVVTINVKDGSGANVTSLPSGMSISLGYIKLVTDAAGNTSWKSYLNTNKNSVAGVGPGGTPVMSSAIQAATQSAKTTSVNNLTNLGNGDYSYTFTANNTTADAVSYDATATHRISMQMSGTGLKPFNAYKDFVPNGDAVTANRKIATTASCLECHKGTFGFHGGSRVEVEYCVTCHNPGTTDPESGNTVNLAVMIHKIHRGVNLPSVAAGGEYAIWGYGGAKHDYSHVGYPQDITNCIKCHKNSAATPQGDNWKTKPSRLACGACHDDVDFAAGTGHLAGAQATDANCANCHNAAYIETKHLTVNATTNNPNVAAGLANFEYVVSSVTVTNDKPVITFQIKKDGSPVTLAAYSAATNTTEMVSGFTGGPGFLIAYADGTDTTIDFNNKGKAAAQPVSVNLIDVWKGTAGALVDNGGGSYTATLTGATAAFPAGAKMRTVAMQAYFTQKAGTGGIAAATGRHALSVVKEVTGDAKRREVVDPAKCGSCHEWFEGHGGGRVIGKGTTGTIVCVLCHNPNLTSSGRKANVANMAQAEKDKLTAAGYDVTNALTFPEASNNMKDMIHGIHASHKRETKYDFVRDRNGGLYYDWSHVTFPGLLSNCETCHNPGTYGAVPAGALSTTDLIGGDAATTSAVNTLRSTVPNASDRITSPITSTCIMCHDGAMPKTHIEQNGGSIKAKRVQ